MHGFENEVTLTLRIANDSEKRKTIRKVSDKLICINTYLNTGRDKNGKYNPLLDFEVHIFTEESKFPTKMIDDTNLNSGDYITVKGSLSSNSHVVKNNSDKEEVFKNMIILASEISAPNFDKVVDKNPIWE